MYSVCVCVPVHMCTRVSMCVCMCMHMHMCVFIRCLFFGQTDALLHIVLAPSSLPRFDTSQPRFSILK